MTACLSESKSLKIISGEPSWLLELLKALPDLLLVLVNGKMKVSLERLQLVDIRIKIKSYVEELAPLGFRNIECGNSKKDTNLLVVSGELVCSNGVRLVVRVTYFMRGERKYFKFSREQSREMSHHVEIPALSLSDIQAFLEVINLDNSIYYLPSLAQLNGRRNPPLPTQMILAITMLQSLTAINLFEKKYSDFTFTFHHVCWPDQALTFSYGHDHEEFHAMISSHNELKVVIFASLSQ